MHNAHLKGHFLKITSHITAHIQAILHDSRQCSKHCHFNFLWVGGPWIL